MTQPFFQPIGNEPAFRDLVNNTQSGRLTEPAVSLKATAQLEANHLEQGI